MGTRIAYLTDSDIIKKHWYWPDTDTRNRYSPNNYMMFISINLHIIS